MKPRSAAGLYAVTLLTSGYYSFFWALSMMSAANALLGNEVFGVRKWRRAVVSGVLLYVGGVIYLFMRNRPADSTLVVWVVFALAVGLLALLIYMVAQIHRAIGKMLPNASRSSTHAIAWLTIMFWVSLPILQNEINGLLATKGGSGAGSVPR